MFDRPANRSWIPNRIFEEASLHTSLSLSLSLSSLRLSLSLSLVSFRSKQRGGNEDKITKKKEKDLVFVEEIL